MNLLLVYGIFLISQVNETSKAADMAVLDVAQGFQTEAERRVFQEQQRLAVEKSIREQVKRADIPQDGMNLALIHAKINSARAPFIRYIWIPNTDLEKWKIMDWVINMVMSRNALIIPSEGIENGKVLALDLRQLAPFRDENGNFSELEDLIKTWELLALDEPYFLTNAKAVTNEVVLVTVTAEKAKIQVQNKVIANVVRGQQLEFVEKRDDGWVEVRFQGERGFIQLTDVSVHKGVVNFVDEKIVRTFGPHVYNLGLQLSALTNSSVPIVRYDWFIQKSLTTADGGLYYNFRGIKKSDKEGQSDLDLFLKKLGSSQKEVELLRSDQKAAIFRSNVTGKPRAVLLFQGQGTQVGTSQGLISIALDVPDNEVDPTKHPIKTLVNNEFAASEVIAEMVNGLHIFALFDNKGVLQLEVPPTIAVDRTVPAPHTTRLQSAISCIKCHTKIGENGIKDEGWKPFGNDVKRLLNGRIQVLGDRRNFFSLDEDIERARNLYLGDFNKAWMRGRDDLSDAILRATKTMTTTEASSKLGEEYDRYKYDMVTPTIACAELGFKVKSDADAVTLLRLILPPHPIEQGFAPEDIFLDALKYEPIAPDTKYMSLNRLEWEQVYVDAIDRVTKALAQGKRTQGK